MAALSGQRFNPSVTIKTMMLPLAGSQKAFLGGMCAADTSGGVVTPATSGNTSLLNIGQFEASVDNSGSTATSFVNVTLAREIMTFWYDNSTGTNKVTAAQLFSDCYMADDHTVTKTQGSNAVAGRVWAVDASLGVLVQPYKL